MCLLNCQVTAEGYHRMRLFDKSLDDEDITLVKKSKKVQMRPRIKVCVW